MAEITKKSQKKGVFFTLISITILVLFILIYTPQADITLQKDTKAISARIQNIDSFINDLQGAYFETVLRATAQKTILSLILYINSTQTYLASFDSSFSEVMVNGTINGIPIDSITNKKIMDNSTLANWSAKISQVSLDTFNLNTSIDIKEVSALQSKPWSIDVFLSINVYVKSDVAKWKKENVRIKTSVSIEDFDDPYYLANTNGNYGKKIKRSSVEFNKWDISQVREHLRNGTYVYWQDSEAPSFLMRFTNTISPSSCCGIESLVNPNKISPSDQIESYVDYLFWAHTFNGQCPLLYNITNPQTGKGLWDEFRYFKLDLYHITKYNITSEYISRTC